MKLTGLKEPDCWSWNRPDFKIRKNPRPIQVVVYFIRWHSGRCAMCGGNRNYTGHNAFAIDHDHDGDSFENQTMGIVRGIMCIRCNTAEGRHRGQHTGCHSCMLFNCYRWRSPAVILGVSISGRDWPATKRDCQKIHEEFYG